jgi:hypothetical protein
LLKLYPFKYRDAVSGIWTRARYKATLEDIRQRYAEWIIDGEPEIRGYIPAASFNPYTAPRAKQRGEPSAIMQPQRERPPTMDAIETVMVSVYLRRYVTYCAGRRRYAAMQGAVNLLREIQTSCA